MQGQSLLGQAEILTSDKSEKTRIRLARRSLAVWLGKPHGDMTHDCGRD